MSLFAELNRRNVFRVAVGYIVSCWLLVEVADLLLENFGAPDWVMQTIILLLVLGFPLVVFFAWAFEVTPEGLKRESEIDRSQSITHITGRKLDRAIIVLLVLAVAYFAYDKFVLSAERDDALSDATTQSVTEGTAAGPQAEVWPDRSIAVLPFVNMSSDEEQEYFSDGLSEELLNLLAKIPQLRVAARTSSFSFKGQNLEIPEIAQRLNVAHVLEGSVRKAGNQVRITAQLVQAEDGYHLWSETYDRTLDNIFAIQDEIAGAVVKQLEVTLLGAVPEVQETDPEAYALYLQARQLGRQNSPESLERSNALYRQVLKIDPDYAAAWDGLATNYYQQLISGLVERQVGLAALRDAVNKALEIDPRIASAHATRGIIALTYDHDPAAAARHIERAVVLEPGNFEVLRSVVTLYRSLGRVKEAIRVSEYMVGLDAMNNNAHFTLGLMHRYSHNLDETISAMRNVLSLSPGRISARAQIAESLMLKGEPEAALAEIQQEESVWRMIGLPMVYHALGRRADSDAALEKLIEAHAQDAAYNIAYVLAYRGEVDRAFEWLEKAIEYEDPGLYDLPIETLFSSLHDDPRWLPLLERLGKSPAQLDAIEFEVELPE